MQQDEYLKILQDGQAEILARQQSHHEEIIQVLLWQNQLISTGRQSSHFYHQQLPLMLILIDIFLAIPQSPRPSFTSTTSPGSPPLTEFSPPPKKRTQSSANSFAWGFTKPLDSNGGTGPVLTRNTRLPRLEKKKRLASLGTQVAYGCIIPAIAREYLSIHYPHHIEQTRWAYLHPYGIIPCMVNDILKPWSIIGTLLCNASTIPEDKLSEQRVYNESPSTEPNKITVNAKHA